MRHKFWISVLALFLTLSLLGQVPDHSIRIVDTLSTQEKANRSPVILRAELDSMIKAYNANIIQEPAKLPEQKVDNMSPLLLPIGLAAILLMLGIMAYQFYRYRRKFNKVVTSFTGKLRYLEIHSAAKVSANSIENKSSISKTSNEMIKEKAGKNKISPAALEGKIGELNDELHQLKKENETLNMVLKEYNGIQHEYDSLKDGLSKAYKVKNYPSYEKSKPETDVLQGVLDTEFSVANYAYEKFLRPILGIADANKNNPAKITEEDRLKVMDLLISLSLLYIEYLYLRVNDLSIGGKMVERINGFQKGNGLDARLLKELNLDHGSRALVLRMILNKSSLQQLSYPVFDETNLNN